MLLSCHRSPLSFIIKPQSLSWTSEKCQRRYLAYDKGCFVWPRMAFFVSIIILSLKSRNVLEGYIVMTVVTMPNLLDGWSWKHFKKTTSSFLKYTPALHSSSQIQPFSFLCTDNPLLSTLWVTTCIVVYLFIFLFKCTSRKFGPNSEHCMKKSCKH